MESYKSYNRTSLALNVDNTEPDPAGGADGLKTRPSVIDLPLDDVLFGGSFGVAEDPVSGYGDTETGSGPDPLHETELDACSCDTAGSVADELVKCIRDTGRVDLMRISKAARVTVSEAIDSLKGSIYCNPDTWGGVKSQGWETADEYL